MKIWVSSEVPLLRIQRNGNSSQQLGTKMRIGELSGGGWLRSSGGEKKGGVERWKDPDGGLNFLHEVMLQKTIPERC